MRKTTSLLTAAPLLLTAFGHAHADTFPTRDVSNDPRTRKVNIPSFTVHDNGRRVTTLLGGFKANGIVQDLKTGRYDRVSFTSKALSQANEVECVSLEFNDTKYSPRLSKDTHWNLSVTVELSNLDPDFTTQASQKNCFYIAKDQFLNNL